MRIKNSMRNEIFQPNEIIFLKYLENCATVCFSNQTVILKEHVSEPVMDKINDNLIWRQGWIVELPDRKPAGVRLIRERKA